MKLNTPDYQLVRMAEHEWRFEMSDEINTQTEKLNTLLDRYPASGGLTSALRRFLNEFSSHIEALERYATCKLEEGRYLDAFAFAHAAVATGRRAFPREFDRDRDTLEGGWVENRPFLRALHLLMQAQRKVFDRSGAIASGLELLVRDPQDRMGVRIDLPELLLAEGRNQEALDLFSRKEFEGSFHAATYLEALAWLRVGEQEKAQNALVSALRCVPEVARYLLGSNAAAPSEGITLQGIVCGSPYEGWRCAARYRRLWAEPAHAMEILRVAAEPVAKAGWTMGQGEGERS